MNTNFIYAVFIWALLIQPFCAKSQDLSAFIKRHAVSIDRQDSLSDDVYRLMSNYRVAMVGELHGTAEPAQFVTALAELFARHDDSVLVGLELPASYMENFLRQHTDSSIYNSRAFTVPDGSGRASAAWAELIRRLNNNGRVKIFFFDAGTEPLIPRDKGMYLHIKKQMQNYPGYKVITLSGNVHNELIPYEGETRMGGYLKSDTELNISDKICSVDHCFGSGTSYNNEGNGTELHKVNNDFTEYSKAVHYTNYLLLLSPPYSSDYNAIYFTRTVTASMPVNTKH
jgi:hypothetical protein